MFGGEKRRLERENEHLTAQLEQQSKSEPKEISKVTVAILSGIFVLVGATIPVWGPELFRQEQLGIAADWKFTSYAGTASTPTISVGEPAATIDSDMPGVEAYNSGVILLALTTEKDKNYTVTDISIESENILDQPKWIYSPPPAAGGGGEISNINLAYTLESREWSNYDYPSGLPNGKKFDPFNLTVDSPATISVAALGAMNSYSFSVFITYQENGKSTLDHYDAGTYKVYGINASAPRFTSDQNRILTIAP